MVRFGEGPDIEKSRFYGKCRKLVKHGKFKSDADMENDISWAFAELFGVPKNPVKRIFGRKTKSQFCTIEEIADVLTENGLSENAKGALDDAKYIVEKNPLSYGFRWERGSDKNGNVAYRLSHRIPYYD